ETPHGVLATFIVGYLAFKVLGIHEGTPTYPGPKQFLRIWPVNEGTVEWPTLRTIIDSTLPSFEDMFVK
ncbi:MAG: hypothetical protein MUP15_05545, partial [Dehalococcoidia bacterium]|nr:hypothetical protein [Dehalococcoidia bacterium]